MLFLTSTCAGSPRESPLLPEAPSTWGTGRGRKQKWRKAPPFCWSWGTPQKQAENWLKEKGEGGRACLHSAAMREPPKKRDPRLKVLHERDKVALSNVKVESSSEWAVWSGGTSGEGSRVLVTEWEILLSVAPRMVLKANVLCFTNVNALLSQVSQFRGRQNTVRVQFSLNCHC